MGDSIVRKTDTRLSRGGGRSTLFTGSKNRACDGESRADHGKRIWRVHTNMMVYAVVIYAFICFCNICMIFYS